MKIRELTEWGRIVKGVNTTADVDTNSISREAGKFGNKVDKDGRPPTLSKKVKGSKTNVLFNLGMAENKKLDEKWSDKYKRSINCSNPKGFSQKAHCAGRNKNEAQELSSVSTIYVDMDGVLADFFGDWAKLMGKDHWTKIDDISPALQKIRDTENFWLDLPLTDNAKNLLALIKDVKGEYNILSSPLPDDPNSEPHKREWIKKNLNFFPPKEVIITHDKARYATTEDGTPNILIDDYGQNIQKWEAAGGIGFKHKDHKFERTAKNIKQHMQEPVESVMESLSASDFPDTYEGVIEKYKDVYAFGTSKRTRVLGGKRLAKELYDKLGQGINHDAYRTIHQIVFGKIKQYETQLHQKREQAGLERQSKEFAKSDMLKSFSTAKNILASILGHAMEALKQPVEEDVKDQFGAILNPLGADSKNLTKIKQSPGFHGLITTMFSQGTFADLEQDEILYYISKLLNINTVEIKAILQKDGFDFTEPDAAERFKQNMDATGGIHFGKTKTKTLNSKYSENFNEEKKQSPAQWQKSMIKKYGEDGWYDIADAVRDYYESNAILDNTISDIIKVKNDHPSFTDYSGITKLYRYEKKDKSGAPTDDEFVPFAYNIKGAKNFVQSMAQGNMGFKKGDFELVEKDFNPGDAILNFTNLIEMVHDAEDDDGEWYKREYEVWMKRTPYYTGTETNENFADGKEKINEIAFLLPAFVSALGVAGTAYSAYDAYKTYEAFTNGEITKEELAKKLGTDFALAVAGASIAKMSFKAFKKLWDQAKTKQSLKSTKAAGAGLPAITNGFLNSKFYNASDDCKASTKKFVEYMKKEHGKEPKVAWLAPPKDAKKFPGKSGEGDAHIMPIVDRKAVDFTAGQFGVDKIPFITPVGKVKDVYKRIGGYFTDAPDWVPGKTTHIINNFDNLPQKALGLAENFADGKKKGKSRPGRVKRSGASCKGSVTSLRKKAKKYSGERGRMYHWCANMKSGRNK